jgi:type II secretory pathway pseudopilin PulG
MQLPETVTLDVPNLLSAGSVIVAVLAAVYSARSARAAQRQAEAADSAVREARVQSELAREGLSEAKRQNRIAAHAHRLEAYKLLLSFRGKVSASGVDFKSDVIWELWEHAQIAEFYFSGEVARRLNDLIDRALAIQSSREEWKDTTNFTDSNRGEKVRGTYDLLKNLRTEIEATDKLMRDELRLVET